MVNVGEAPQAASSVRELMKNATVDSSACHVGTATNNVGRHALFELANRCQAAAAATSHTLSV